MESIFASITTFLVIIAAFACYQWYEWRQRAMKMQAFIQDPNVKQVDKQAEYKESYEAKLNALSGERQQQHEAMNEVFDFINDNYSDRDHPLKDPRVPGLMQCRNVLLKAIADSTYGRE